MSVIMSSSHYNPFTVCNLYIQPCIYKVSYKRRCIPTMKGNNNVHEWFQPVQCTLLVYFSTICKAASGKKWRKYNELCMSYITTYNYLKCYKCCWNSPIAFPSLFLNFFCCSLPPTILCLSACLIHLMERVKACVPPFEFWLSLRR